MARDDIRDQIYKALDHKGTNQSRIDESPFAVSEIFSNWFHELGSAYFFLFKKNLKVTNIQYAELAALIRLHTTQCNGDPVSDLQLLSRNEFLTAFHSIIQDFKQGDNDNENIRRCIAEYCNTLIFPIVVVENFYGSCAVFLPPHLTLDIKAVCEESGYIHSCGRNIFTRNVSKTTKDEFYQSLKDFLKKYYPDSKKIPFIAYAHEDFTQFDRDMSSDLRDGLDDVKIYLEKFHMGPDSLVKVLKGMTVDPDLSGKLVIPPPGDYRSIHRALRDDPEHHKDSTIWLLADNSIGSEQGMPGPDKFYICFAQEFRNQNPFHIFDENKPAWIAHTTIPHTLAGAMVNLSRPAWPTDTKVVLADPFVGTGTFYLESLKFSNFDLYCSDAAPISPLLAKDNLKFFNFTKEQLETIVKRLENSLTNGENTTPKLHAKSDRDKTAYKWACNMQSQVFRSKDDDEAKFTVEIVEKLEKKNFFSRILFYLTLRATIRKIHALDRESTEWQDAFKAEVDSMIIQIKRLARLKSQTHFDKGHGIFSLSQGTYSKDCSINIKGLINEQKAPHRFVKIQVLDATKWQSNGQNKFDVIITDPPYGFNTNETIEGLAKLYSDVIRQMIYSLKDDGQLILCLPERSYTGRRSPYFTHKQIVTQQIFAEAESAGKEVLYSAHLVPPPSYLYRPPYYWESERALRRSIIHFRFRSIPAK